MRGKKRRWLPAIAGLALLLVAVPAYALELRVGDLIVIGDGGFTPKTLPRDHDAPITLHGGGKISTISGELPPILQTITFEFDRHGSLQTLGLPVCTAGKLEATTVQGARNVCPGAIVGKGFGRALIKFPEQPAFPVSSPITIFNGPKKGGDDTVFAHAYTTVPVPTTFVIPIVIERIHDGVYGYRVNAKVPKIAGGAGIPVSGSLKVGRRWTYKGVRHSYVNARCETGRLQARGEFTFSDGTYLRGTFFKPCKVRK